MGRQSISLTEPNDKWLRDQVESKEYASKSELVNDLIRQARKEAAQLKNLRTKLAESEAGGFTTETKEEILQAAKSIANG